MQHRAQKRKKIDRISETQINQSDKQSSKALLGILKIERFSASSGDDAGSAFAVFGTCSHVVNFKNKLAMAR